MKTGDVVHVRPVGQERWVECRVEIASENGQSLALSAVEGLPTMQGFAIDRRNGRMMLLLSAKDDGFEDVVSGGRFEVKVTEVA